MRDSIPTLPLWLDKIIRKSYRGGSVDVYRVQGYEAYYYDINSLYPYAICQDIPYEYLGFKFKPDLDHFFGFIMAHIYIPKNVKIPLVGVKTPEGSLYYPTGHIYGLYFSEELKAFKQQGYKVTCMYGYEFSKADLFSNYVKSLYSMKASSTGAKRTFVKLLLNGLYGYFGRNPNTISATFLNEIPNIFKTHKVIDTIPIENLLLVLHETLPDRDLCEQNNISYNKVLHNTLMKNLLITNVAIASAITSYARIRMIFFKCLPDNEVLYSDTDSVFLIKPLNREYVDSQELGIMKDELKGHVITNYLFLEPKLYYYKTDSNEEVIKARGVHKGELTTSDMIALWEGKTINMEFTRLYKSIRTISISEKHIKYSLSRTYNRKVPVFNAQNQLISYRPKHLSFIDMLRTESP